VLFGLLAPTTPRQPVFELATPVFPNIALEPENAVKKVHVSADAFLYWKCLGKS